MNESYRGDQSIYTAYVRVKIAKSTTFTGFYRPNFYLSGYQLITQSRRIPAKTSQIHIQAAYQLEIPFTSINFVLPLIQRLVMKANYDSGYGLNATNLEKMGALCETYAPRYNPDPDSLKPAGILALATRIDVVQIATLLAKGNYTTSVNQRKEAFVALDALTGFVIKTLKKAGKNNESAIDIINELKKSRRAKKLSDKGTQGALAAGPEEERKKRAAESKTYENRQAHFAQALQLLQQFDGYKPTNSSTKVASLLKMNKRVEELNHHVSDTEREMNTRRNERDAMLTGNEDSLQYVVTSVKDEVRYIFKEDSNEYKQLVKLKFAW